MKTADRTPLTKRELEVASLAAHERTCIEIADDLFVSVNTVKTHLRHIYEKTGVSSRLQLYLLLAGTDSASANAFLGSDGEPLSLDWRSSLVGGR